MRAWAVIASAGVVATSAVADDTARQTVSNSQMIGLAGAIKKQIEPCYEMGDLNGTDAVRIVTTLRLRYNKDGSIAGQPELVEQTGIDNTNRQYADGVARVAFRAVVRCAPLHLPHEFYEGGWDDLNFRFTPASMKSK